MRNLKHSMNIKPDGMSEFQVYIKRERESYLKSLHDLSNNNNNLTHNFQARPGNVSFNLGSL